MWLQNASGDAAVASAVVDRPVKAALGAAQRDAAVRERILAQLGEPIEGTDSWSATKRGVRSTFMN